MVHENAQTLQVTWAITSVRTIPRQLEDRVEWQQLPEEQSQLPHTVDRLVTTFSPHEWKGRRPSLESAPGTKRTATEVDLPGRSDGSRRRTPDTASAPAAAERATTPAEQVAPQAEQSQDMHGETTTAEPPANTMSATALATYCRSCGSQDTTLDAAQQTCCVRCLA